MSTKMYISVKSNAQRNKKCKENPDPKWNPGYDDFRAKPHPIPSSVSRLLITAGDPWLVSR